MPDKSVELRLILSGIFLMSDFFDKCSVFLLRFSINAGHQQQKTRRGKCLLREKRLCYWGNYRLGGGGYYLHKKGRRLISHQPMFV